MLIVAGILTLTQATATDPPRVTLHLSRRCGSTLDGVRVSDGELQERLSALAAREPVVTVDPDTRTRFGCMAHVLAILERSGINPINIASAAPVKKGFSR